MLIRTLRKSAFAKVGSGYVQDDYDSSPVLCLYVVIIIHLLL